MESDEKGEYQYVFDEKEFENYINGPCYKTSDTVIQNNQPFVNANNKSNASCMVSTGGLNIPNGDNVYNCILTLFDAAFNEEISEPTVQVKSNYLHLDNKHKKSKQIQDNTLVISKTSHSSHESMSLKGKKEKIKSSIGVFEHSDEDSYTDDVSCNLSIDIQKKTESNSIESYQSNVHFTTHKSVQKQMPNLAHAYLKDESKSEGPLLANQSLTSSFEKKSVSEIYTWDIIFNRRKRRHRLEKCLTKGKSQSKFKELNLTNTKPSETLNSDIDLVKCTKRRVKRSINQKQNLIKDINGHCIDRAIKRIPNHRIISAKSALDYHYQTRKVQDLQISDNTGNMHLTRTHDEVVCSDNYFIELLKCGLPGKTATPENSYCDIKDLTDLTQIGFEKAHETFVQYKSDFRSLNNRENISTSDLQQLCSDFILKIV